MSAKVGCSELTENHIAEAVKIYTAKTLRRTKDAQNKKTAWSTSLENHFEKPTSSTGIHNTHTYL